jgi:hypothetical protein
VFSDRQHTGVRGSTFCALPALGACGVGSVGDGILSDVAWTDIIDAANDLMPRRWKHCVAMSWWLWAWSFPARFREP